MSQRSKKKHWTHQQGIAKRLHDRYDKPLEKFYVVFRGKTTGIYRTWDECSRQVTGHPAPIYKAYPSMKLAEAALFDFHKKADPKREKLGRGRATAMVNANSVNGNGSRHIECTSVTCTYPRCQC